MPFDFRVCPVRLMIVAAYLLLTLGCGASGPEKGTVSGKVTFEGKALTEGAVHLYCQETGIGAMVLIDASGNYRVDTPLRTGDYAVYVTPKPAEPGIPTKHVGNIPKKYNDMTTSGLSCTIKAGANDFPIAMTD